ncbi:MAG: phage tail tube protein [Candidatus Caldarchaeum sp.]|nr:phage tail tube protein [Candidatus Caldarchaeum sp.]
MSVMTARTGAFAYLRYGWESTFKTAATTRDKVFGRGQRISSLTRRENPELLYELGGRIAQASAFKQFEGAVSVEWILSNPWFLRGVMGQVTTTGSGPYTHTFTKTNLPQSMTLEVGATLSGSNVVRTLSGCVFSSVAISASVGELVRVRGEIMYASEAVGTTAASPLVDTFEPFVFTHATLEIPQGTVIAEVQSFDLTINNNALMVYGLGGREPVSAVWQAFDASGSLSVTMKNATFLNYLRSEVGNGRLVVSSGANNSITFNLSGLTFGEHSVSVEPNALVVENLPIQIRDIPSIVAINNVATAP